MLVSHRSRVGFVWAKPGDRITQKWLRCASIVRTQYRDSVGDGGITCQVAELAGVSEDHLGRAVYRWSAMKVRQAAARQSPASVHCGGVPVGEAEPQARHAGDVRQGLARGVSKPWRNRRGAKPSGRRLLLIVHGAFKKELATSKLRDVFNELAAQRGLQSLNDLQGPGSSLLPSIDGLLCIFRARPIALHADIRKAFFTIAVGEEDQPYLRSIWPKGDSRLNAWRLTRLPFGVNCSPFIIKAVLCHLLETASDYADPV